MGKVAHGKGSEVAFDTSLLEVIAVGVEKELKESDSSTPSRISGLSRKRRWVLGSVLLLQWFYEYFEFYRRP